MTTVTFSFSTNNIKSGNFRSRVLPLELKNGILIPLRNVT